MKIESIDSQRKRRNTALVTRVESFVSSVAKADREMAGSQMAFWSISGPGPVPEQRSASCACDMAVRWHDSVRVDNARMDIERVFHAGSRLQENYLFNTGYENYQALIVLNIIEDLLQSFGAHASLSATNKLLQSPGVFEFNLCSSGAIFDQFIEDSPLKIKPRIKTSRLLTQLKFKLYRNMHKLSLNFLY